MNTTLGKLVHAYTDMCSWRVERAVIYEYARKGIPELKEKNMNLRLIGGGKGR
jgi:hypothetical protein